MQAGAFSYLTKPINFQEVAQVVEAAAATGDLIRENRAMKQALAVTGAGANLIGQALSYRKSAADDRQGGALGSHGSGPGGKRIGQGS